MGFQVCIKHADNEEDVKSYLAETLGSADPAEGFDPQALCLGVG